MDSSLFLRSALLVSMAAALGAVLARAGESGRGELFERSVDAAALSSQENAISRLSALLKKYRGTAQEPIFLVRLAEAQQQAGSIRFRIAHGTSHSSRRAPALAGYRKTLRQSISTLNDLIVKYPRHGEVAQAYFMRGKAYEELEEKGPATRDYLHLVESFPDAPEALPAYMSLAEFSIGANDHARAVSFLKQVEKRPDTPYYPFALFKLGWSYYNLRNIPTALSYVERHTEHYRNARSSQDLSLRENMILDAAIFYTEGYEQKLPLCQVDGVIDYFKRLDPGPVAGKALVRFAKLLRSHGHESDLIQLKDQVILSEPDRPESLEILMITYENQLNHRRYAQLPGSAKDMVGLYRRNKNFEAFPKGRKLLIESAERIQGLILKNKGTAEASALGSTLASLYLAFTEVVEESDPRIPGVRYNLAETLFEIRDYDQATKHYRWIVDHGDWSRKAARSKAARAASLDAQVTVEDASLKAIGARYESLRQRRLVPASLSAQAMPKEDPRQIDPDLKEWVQWIDTHVEKTGEPLEPFAFEAARTLYAQGHIRAATERMRRSAVDRPGSRYAIPAASLVLDSWIASSDWEQTHSMATDLLAVQAWKGSEFGRRLFAVAADSFFKIIENLHRDREHREALRQAEIFFSRYSASSRLGDCLAIAGASALAINERGRAASYFSRLIAEAPSNARYAEALASRAAIEEELYHFASAARDYRAYLSQKTRKPASMGPAAGSGGDSPAAGSGGGFEEDSLRRKVLMMAWISGDAGELRAALSSESICVPSLSQDCDRYRALAILLRPGSAPEPEDAIARARKSVDANRALWAAIALEDVKKLAYRDRLYLARQIAAHWLDLDPLMQFALLPRISEGLAQVFRLTRLSMREIAPLRPNERYITRRVEVIREIENAATQVMKLSWARIRASVLNEIASLYLDLARELSTLPPPKGLEGAELAAYEETVRKLVMPFEDKAQEMRRSAFELASGSAIDREAFEAIAEPFFLDNPSQAKTLRHQIPTKQGPIALDLALLRELDPEGGWAALLSKSASSRDESDPERNLKAHWAEAMRWRNWAQVAFLLQEGKERALVQSAPLGLIRAVSLAAIGARAEALSELDSTRKELPESANKAALRTLIGHYFSVYAREKTQALILELRDIDPESRNPDPESRETALLAHASRWVN